MNGVTICAVLAFFGTCTWAAAAANVTIGVLMPATSGASSRYLSAITAAVDTYRSLAPNVQVNVLFNNSGSTVAQCNSMMVWQQRAADPIAWLGTTNQALTMTLSGVATGFERPLLSWVAQTSTLSDRAQHPYLLRTIPSDDRTSDALWAMIQYYGWDRVAIVHTNDDRGQSLANCMKASTPLEHRLSRYPFEAGNQDSINDVVDQLIDEKFTVFVVHGARTEISPVLVRAMQKKIMGPGYVWMGKDWGGPTQTSTYNNQTLRGVLMLVNSLDLETNPAAVQFKQDMVRVRPETTEADWSSREGAAYDATVAIMRSIVELYSDPALMNLGIGPGMMKALMERVDFNGPSGHVRFTSMGDILSTLQIYTVDRQGKWVGIGSYTPAVNRSDEVLDISGKAVFGDGSYRVSPDYVEVYHDGDILPVTYDTFPQLLGFALSLIGTWTASVFVEQAVSQFRASKARKAAGETPDYDGCCGVAWKFYFKRYEYLFWLFLAAVTLAGVGISCMGVVAFTAAKLPEESHGLRLDSTLASIAAPASIFWVFLGMLCELRDENVGKEEKKGVKPYLLKNENTKQTVYAQVRAQWSRSLEELKQAFRSISRWTVLFVFFLSLGIFASHYSLALALAAEHARHELDNNQALPAAITVLIFVSLASILFFHVLKSKLRLLAAPLLSLGILAGQRIILQNDKYIFEAHDLHDDGGGEGNTVQWLQTIVTSVGVAFCFIFIGLQVTRLKLSRGALDRLLEQSQDQLHRLEAQVAEERVAKAYAQSECNEAKNMLELINFARPLFRNHALAHALADRRGASLNKEHEGTTDDGERGQGQVSIWALGLAAPKNERTVAALLAELNAMPSLHSGPVNDRAHNDVKLTELLSHPVTLEILKDTVMRSLAPESVALLLDIQRYRSVDRSSLRVALAQELVNCYILPDAPYCVNISSTMRHQIQAAARTGHVNGATFDEVETELLKLISTNTMDAFYTSTAFKICCLLLEHPAYRLKTNIRRGVQSGGGPGSSHSSSNPRTGLHARQSKNSSKDSKASKVSRGMASSIPASPGLKPQARNKRQISQSGTNTNRTMAAEPESPVHPVSVAWGVISPSSTESELLTPGAHGTRLMSPGMQPQGSTRRLMHKPPDRQLPKSSSGEQKSSGSEPPLHAHNMSMVLDGDLTIAVAPEDESSPSTDGQPSL